MYNWFSKFSVHTPNTKTYSVSVSSTNADGSSLALGCICFTPFIVQQGFNTNGLDSDWLSIFWGNQSFPLTECKGQGTFYRWSGKKDESHCRYCKKQAYKSHCNSDPFPYYDDSRALKEVLTTLKSKWMASLKWLFSVLSLSSWSFPVGEAHNHICQWPSIWLLGEPLTFPCISRKLCIIKVSLLKSSSWLIFPIPLVVLHGLPNFKTKAKTASDNASIDIIMQHMPTTFKNICQFIFNDNFVAVS